MGTPASSSLHALSSMPRSHKVKCLALLPYTHCTWYALTFNALFWKIALFIFPKAREELATLSTTSLVHEPLLLMMEPKYLNSSTTSISTPFTSRVCSSGHPPTTMALVLGVLMVRPYLLVTSNSLLIACTAFSNVGANTAVSSANCNIFHEA